MGRWLADPFTTLMPALLAGVLNMVWVKLPLARRLDVPLDRGRVWRDGRPVFGPNKTWKGLVGMTGLAAICSLVWGAVCAGAPGLERHHRVYQQLGDSWTVSLVYGLVLGLVYALAELPNSFFKRRLGVDAGRSAHGPGRFGLIALDQCDSVLAMVLATWLPARLAAWELAWWSALGGVTHLAVNAALFAARLRRSPV
jgi:hypothetical protein